MRVSTAVVVLLVAGCGDDDDGGPDPDRPFGETAIVVLVNPVINQENSAPAPVSYAPAPVEGVAIDAVPGGDDVTDREGLAVLTGLGAGDLEVVLDGGPSLAVLGLADGDVLDLAVGYDGSAVGPFANFPIVYAVGGDILVFDAQADPQAVTDALDGSGNIVFFEDGVHVGDILITGDDVIFFGEGFTERDVVIDGSVEVRGTAVRIRGFTITGDLRVLGNRFGMSWSTVRGSTTVSGEGVSLLANQLCGPGTIPSSNATILHNTGLAPLGAPPEEACQP